MKKLIVIIIFFYICIGPSILIANEAGIAGIGGIEIADMSTIFPIRKNSAKLSLLTESEMRIGTGMIYPQFGNNFSYKIGYSDYIEFRNTSIGGYGIDIENINIDDMLIIDTFSIGYGMSPFNIFKFLPENLCIGINISYVKKIFKYNEWIANYGYNNAVLNNNFQFDFEAAYVTKKISTIILLSREEDSLYEVGLEYNDTFLGKLFGEIYFRDYSNKYGIRVGIYNSIFNNFSISAGYDISRFEQFKGGVGINWKIKFKDMDMIIKYGMPLNFSMERVLGSEYYLSLIFLID